LGAGCIARALPEKETRPPTGKPERPSFGRRYQAFRPRTAEIGRHSPISDLPHTDLPWQVLPPDNGAKRQRMKDVTPNGVTANKKTLRCCHVCSSSVTEKIAFRTGGSKTRFVCAEAPAIDEDGDMKTACEERFMRWESRKWGGGFVARQKKHNLSATGGICTDQVRSAVSPFTPTQTWPLRSGSIYRRVSIYSPTAVNNAGGL
jgi:hypothetical protein